MSFRKYGGTNKLEKNNNITVHSIVADTFTIRDAFLSVFTIEGDLQIGGNGIISNNLTVSQQINATTLDISLNATIDGYLYLDKAKDVFLKGDTHQMIGINKSTPTATLDISSNKVQAFNLKTSAANNRNIIARNLTNNGIAVTARGTSESGIQFYSANTGTIDVSNAQGAIIKYSNTDSLLTIDSTGGDVKVTSKMIITDNTTNGNTHTSFGETVLIYDKDNGANQPVFFNEAYGNTSVKTGSALTVQSINNASNTFVNIVTPNSLGIQIGGGSYPKDPTRSMGVIDVYNPSIDTDATPSMILVSGDSVTKFNSTTGFNTFQPKYNNYAVDINGPLHLNNGEVKKTIDTTMRITQLYNFGSSYGIAIGGQGLVDGSIRYFTYTTNNGGKSWTRNNALTSTDVNSSIESGAQTYKSVYSYSATRTIIGGTGSSLWVTDNGATNWYQLFITGGILTINAIYTPSGISENFVYIGGDTGSGNATIRYGYIESFTHVYTGLTGNPTATRYRYTDVSYNYPITNGIISDFSGSGQNFLVVGGNKIMKFDLGVSKMVLTFVSEYTNPGAVTYLAIRLADANNAVAVGGNVISYTKNGGTTWTTANIASLSGKTFNDVFLDGSMNAIVVGNNGYIYSSNDGYYTWKLVDEDALNASGVGSRITDSTNDITSVFMPDSSTIILSIVKNNDSNALAAKLYYLNMPNIFNNKQNFLFDVSGCMRMSGDLIFSEGGEIISKDTTFNFVTKNVATLNAATNALAINMGGTNTTNIAIGGANTATLLAGGINTGNVIIGGNVTTSKIGPLNISPLTNGNVRLSNDLVTGNVYQSNAVIAGNLQVTNGIVTIRSTNNSTSTATGSLVVYGGLGVAKDVYSGGNIYSLRDINLSGNLYSSGNALVMTSNDNISASTSGNTIVYTSNTGTLQIGGGTAISKNIYIGGTTFCGGDLVVQGQITYLGGTVSTSTTFSSAIVASPLRGNSNSNVDYNYTYRPIVPPTTYNDIGFGAGALTTEGGFAVALDSWLIGNLRVDGANNIITRLVESTSVNTGALQIRGGVGIGGNLYIGGNVIINNTTESNSTVSGALQIRGGVGIGNNANIGGNVIINSTIESNSTVTGALQIRGGVGIGSNVYTGGNVIINSIIESNSTITGALQIRGGVGIGKNANIGGNVIINSTIESNSTVTGALQIIGGVGIGMNANIGGNVIINSTIESNSTVTGALQIRGGVGIGKNANIGGNVIIYSTTESTSTATGALQIKGGVGIGKNANIGGNVIINATTESNSTVTGALQVRGGIGVGGSINTGGSIYTTDLTTSGQAFINSLNESSGIGNGAAIIDGGLSVKKNANIGGNVIINSTTESNSTVTGALQVRGGIGVGGSINTGGSIYTTDLTISGQAFINSTNESTTIGNGAAILEGGLGVKKNANIGGNVIIYSTTESTSTVTGALQIRGGVGIGRNMNIGGNVNIGKITIVLDTTDSSSTDTGAFQVKGGIGVANKIVSASLSTGPIGATNLTISSSEASANTFSGALIVRGGIGVGGSINTGGSVYTTDITTSGQAFINSTNESTTTADGAAIIGGGLGVKRNANIGGNVIIYSTTESASTVTGALQIRGGIGIGRNANIGGNVIIYSTIESTSTVTGALQIRGGVGIGMNTNIGGNVIINSIIASNNTVTGALQVRGGIGVGGSINTGGSIYTTDLTTSGQAFINSTNESTTTADGAAIIGGGLGVKRNANIGGNVIIYSTIESTSTVSGALQIRGGVGIGMNTNIGGNVIIYSTIESTSTVTGSLQVRGGVGIGMNTNIGGNVIIYSKIESTSTVSGALQIRGGVGIGMNANIGGNVIIYSTIESTSTVSGALQIRGGVGIGMNTNIGGNLIIYSTIESTSTVTGALQIRGGVGIGMNTNIGGNVIIYSTIESTSTVSGALQVRGGVGIGGNVQIGGTLNVIGASTFTENIRVNNAKGINIVAAGTGTRSTLKLLEVNNTYGFELSNSEDDDTFRISSNDNGSLVNKISITRTQTTLANTSTNITANGNTASSFNVLTANGGGGSYNQLTAGSGSFNYITASDGATTNKLQGNTIFENFSVASVVTINNTNGLVVTSTSASTSTSTGALVVSGGVGISGRLNVGGNLLLGGGHYDVAGPSAIRLLGDDPIGFAVGFQTLRYLTSSSHVFFSGSAFNDNGTARLTINSSGLTTPNNVSCGSLNVTGASAQAAITASGLVTASAGLTVNTGLLYTGTDLVFWNTARGGGVAQTAQLGLAMVHETGNSLVINYGGTNSFSGGVEVRGGISSINTSTGSFRVVGGVGISGNLNVGGLGIFTNNNASTNTSTGTLRVTGGIGLTGAIFAGGTITAPTFNAASDMRIKKDITDMNSHSSLTILRKIKPREYTMIDGSKESIYGFIAQEVKEFIPKSTHLVKSFIPSVYENAFVDGNQITLINKTTTDMSGCQLKLRDENGGDMMVNVTSIKDGKTFTIDTDISSNIFCVDTYGNKLDKHTNNGITTYMQGSHLYTGEVTQGIFVYGIEVDDFHTINKDTIFTVTLNATQEMDSQLQEARHTIRTLEERIAAIERRLS